MAWKERYMEAVDVETSYRLAKEMESYRSNPKLGYRPAGSRAEFETGERLKKEMEAMGLSNVRPPGSRPGSGRDPGGRLGV